MALTQFHDVSFPLRLTDKTHGGPAFPLTVLYGDTGGEFRRVAPSSGLNIYEITHTSVSPSEQTELITFFRAREGGRFSFRFHDRYDDRTDDSLIATADGNRNAFELYKRYESGDNAVLRRIFLPSEEEFRLYIDGVEQAPSTYTLDTLQGIVTCDSMPPNGAAISAAFTFDVPVRFDTERLSFRYETNGRTSLSKPPVLREVRA